MPYSSAIIDPYVELNVLRNASQQEIKQAYRKIALASHPDHHANDPTAAERFRRASVSYALLRDPKRRLAFDTTGRWDDERWEPGELDTQLVEALEIFARDFGAAVELPQEDQVPAHAGRITMSVDVTYEEVERGARRRIPAPCSLCSGSGAREGSAHVRCTSCGGSGRLRHVESSLLGPRIHTEQCESCHGSGRRPILVCPGCEGTGHAPSAPSVEVLIPRGTDDGDSLAGVSSNGFRFVARLVEDQRWARDGADLYVVERIPYEIAVLGGTIEVVLPGRRQRVDVAPATASGHRLRLQGQGLPLRDGSGRGDLVLTLHVTVPERVGRFERWLLKARRGRFAVVDPQPQAGRVARAHAWAQEAAHRHWSSWREQHQKSAVLRIEKTAASLRSAALLLSESEQRLGPLLEAGFAVIAPEAARARGRLEGARARNAVFADFVVDSLLALGLGAGVWFLAWYAGPAITAAGDHAWWNILRRIHPATFALISLLAGFGAGAVRGMAARRSLQIVTAVPFAIMSALAVVATGTAVYATVMHLAPAAHPFLRGLMSAVAAFAAGIAPVSMFLAGNSIVDRGRKAVQAATDLADKRTLRKFDSAAARLATHLEGTERAFRLLLTQADDARHPLTSLLNGAADTLANDQRRIRSNGVRAALSLGASLAIALLWLATTTLAVATAFTLRADAATWLQLATAIAAAILCTLGSVLPATLLERPRPYVFTTGFLTLVAFVTLVGIMTSGAGTGWLAAGAAAAGLALSFRLRASIHALTTAARLAAFSALALLLWPLAASTRSRGTLRA